MDATELQKQILDIAFTDVVREVSDVEKLRWVGERTPHEDRLTGQANTSLLHLQLMIQKHNASTYCTGMVTDHKESGNGGEQWRCKQ